MDKIRKFRPLWYYIHAAALRIYSYHCAYYYYLPPGIHIYTTQHTSYTTKNCDLRKHGVESACWIINGIKSYGYSKITAQSTAVTYRLVLLYDHDGWGLLNYMTLYYCAKLILFLSVSVMPNDISFELLRNKLVFNFS